MMADSLYSQATFGALGGLALELLHWYRLSRKYNGSKVFRASTVYWFCTAGMVVLAALMPLLYLSGSASALLCFHLGAATPLLIQRLADSAPAIARKQGAGFGIRDFIAW